MSLRISNVFLLAVWLISCHGPQSICDSIEGGCLAITIEGSGSFENLRFTALSSTNSTLKSGELAMSATLPYLARVSSPPGIDTDTIAGLRIEGIQNSQVVANGTTPAGFSWPSGTNVDTTVTMTPGPPAPPGPLLTWREERAPTGFSYLLYDVWADRASDSVVAVGENGSALHRVAGTWTAENTGLTSLLNSVVGISSGVIWTVGQLTPAAARRDSVTMTWSADQPAGLTGKGFWCVTAGQAIGELWAGDNDGKVWHRLGSPSSNGTWTSEQALPGVGVYAIAYADGAVFAVGNAGNVAVRKDSNPATSWTQTKISGNFSASDWWNGVRAFDRNTAVAVGTAGSLVTYQGGSWAQAAQKIDLANSEMTAVWGMTGNRLWVTSKNGFLLRVDGTNTYKIYTKEGAGLYGVFGLNESDIYAVGGTSGQPSLLVRGTP